jgi:VWFA-related protein
MWRSRRLQVIKCKLLVAAVMGTGIPDFAQGQGSGSYVIRANVCLINADITVLDKRNGAPIDGLSQGDFRVMDNGREQPISHFAKVASDDLPLALILILDTSHADRRSVQALADASESVLRKLKPGDKIAIVKFSPDYNLVQEFSSDVDETVTALRNLAASIPEHGEKHRSDPSQPADQAIRLACKKVLELANHRRQLKVIGSDLTLLPKGRQRKPPSCFRDQELP